MIFKEDFSKDLTREKAIHEEKLLFSLPGKREQFLSQIALKRMATPDDISKGVEFFVTDLGDYVTGQCLSMCGGVIKF